MTPLCFCVVNFRQRLFKMSPLTKIHFAVGNRGLYEMPDWNLWVSEQKKKSYWSLKVSYEVKKCQETMTNEESENDGGYQSMRSRTQMGKRVL